MIINQAFAERFWPGRDAVGQRVRTREGTALEIVGVVNTTKIRSLGEDPRPAVYLPILQFHPSAVWIVARTSGDARAAGHRHHRHHP